MGFEEKASVLPAVAISMCKTTSGRCVYETSHILVMIREVSVWNLDWDAWGRDLIGCNGKVITVPDRAYLGVAPWHMHVTRWVFLVHVLGSHLNVLGLVHIPKGWAFFSYRPLHTSRRIAPSVENNNTTKALCDKSAMMSHILKNFFEPVKRHSVNVVHEFQPVFASEGLPRSAQYRGREILEDRQCGFGKPQTYAGSLSFWAYC